MEHSQSATLAPAPRRANEVWRELIGALIVLLAAAGMLAWTWPYTPDPVIDFSREIYLAWQMSEGRVLYRDLNYVDGPLGLHVLAGVFKLAGASLATLKTFNALVTVAIALLVYRLIREIGDRISATAAGVTFAVVFACGQLTWDASFNFLTPYSHNLTYGVGLSLAMAGCLWKHAQTRRTGWLAAGGALWGLVALTKAEVLLAASAAAVVTVAASMWMRRVRGIDVARELVALLLPAMAVIALAMLLLPPPWRLTLGGIAGAWRFTSDGQLLRMTYFRWLTGTNELEENLVNLFAWTGRYGLVVLPAAALGLVLRRKSWRTILIVSVTSALIVALVLSLLSARIAWAQVGRPLPALLGILAVGLAARVVQERRREADPKLLLALTLTCLGAALLVKMILRVNFHHYGFGLAMPGAMVLVVALLAWVPRWSGGGTFAGWAARAVVLAAWGVYIGNMLYTTRAWIERRPHPVASGLDRFYADERGKMVGAALAYLRAHGDPGDTLAAIPEGSLLNFLARMPGTVRYHNYLPPELVMFGEDRMLAALRADPPDWIALMHADTTIYDAPNFGEHYARDLARWIVEHYERTELIGAPPFTGKEFGILILRHRPPAQ